ncbi:MAG: amino acid ABC transporter substrate-binding protein [Spirochaetaceae bacterium]|nr:amino acid ABC transporter substrate-binding protein [Spirochaetaceae bacterium]
MRFMFKPILLLLLFFILLSFAGAQEFSAGSGGDIEGILKRGKLVVAITAVDQPPFYFVDKNGKLRGYDIDLASKMADELGVKLEITRDAPAFNDLVTLVASGKADMAVSKLSRTLSRAKTVKFSTPYMTFKQGLLFNRLQLAKVASEEEINNYVRDYRGVIGVIANSSYANYAKINFPHAQIKEFPTWDAAVKALTNGEVLSVYRDELEIKKVLSSIPQSSLILKPVYFTDLTDPIAVAVKNENSQLLYWVNIFLENQKKMTADEILSTYANQ